MFVRFSFVLFLCLFAFTRTSFAACACASPDDRVKLGFRQVSQFAGKLTAKFYVGDQEIVEARRTYTAGTVAYDTATGRYYVEAFGCGEFPDTVFITSTVGQEIKVVTTFVDDPSSPDYTEIGEMDEGGLGVLTVFSMPSADCLTHYASLAGAEYQRVVPGVRMITPEFEGNTITDRYVTRKPADAVGAAGASSGPASGLLGEPPDQSSYLDAQPLESLCGGQALAMGMPLGEESTSASSTSDGLARAADSNVADADAKKKSIATSGSVGRIHTPFARGLSSMDPFSDGKKGPPEIPDFRPPSLRRGASATRADPLLDPPTPASAEFAAQPPAAPLSMKGQARTGVSPRSRSTRDRTSATTSPSSAPASAEFIADTAIVAAESTTPGDVAQAGIGSLNMSIELGHLQGRLLYVTPAIDAQAYSAARLHLSKDVNPESEIHDVDGALRQAWLAESFVDVRTLSSSALEVRLYHHSQIGAFDGTVYVITDDAPFCVWRIENPDQAPAGRVRFVENRNGRTTAHLARWQAASGDNAGILTLAFNNEAMIETRTFYYFASPSPARGERIQRSAGPLAAPGPIVSDVYEVYQEFYNWSATGAIHEALTQRIDDPEGAALTTTYVYYDIPGMAANALNGVIYPDGYWERYARFTDGRVAKTYRPFKDGPSHPSAATDANSIVSHITFPDTGDPFYEIEVRDEVFQNQVLIGHEEIHRQDLGDVFAETHVVSLNGATFTQSQTIQTGRGGLPVQVHDATGRSSKFTYASGFWDAATEAFSLAGPGVRARRATETQGSLVHPNGVANQTLIVVRVSDDEGRVVLEETYVNDGSSFVAGSRSDWINRVVRSYDSRGLLLRETRDGRVASEAGYDAEGRLEFTIDEQGIRTDFVYDSFGRVEQAIRRRGAPSPDQTTTYQYDVVGRVRFETVSAAGLSSTTEYRYDLAGRRTHVITPDGLVETTSELRYVDANGAPVRREITVTAPSGATSITEFYRDRSLFRRHGTGTAPEIWTHSYDGPSGYALRYRVKQLSDTLPVFFEASDWVGNVRQETRRTVGGAGVVHRHYFFDGGAGAGSSVRGLLSRVESAGQAPVLFEYDEFGRRSAEGLDLDANGSLDYTGSDSITSHTLGFINEGSPAAWFSFARDYRYLTPASGVSILRSETKEKLTGLDAGLVVDRTVFGGAGRRVRETVALDRATRTRITTTRDLAADPAASPEIRTEVGGLVRTVRRAGATTDTSYSYDGLDRLIAVDDPVAGSVTYGFDAQGRLASRVDGLERTTRFTYHPNGVIGAGQIATEENAAGRIARFAYTLRNQIYRQWGAETYPTEYSYDTEGRLVGLRTFRTDDSAVDWSQSTWPALGGVTGDLTQWTYEYWSNFLSRKTYADGSEVSYAYDAFLRLHQRTNARGQVTTYGYDGAGRLASIGYPVGSGTANVSYVYDRGGRIASIDDGAGARMLTYTDFDQLETETYGTGLLTGVVLNRGFDASNRAATLAATDATGTLTAYAYDYDELSRLNSITHETAGGGPLMFTYAYTPGTGRWETLTTTRAAATVATATRGYDDIGRLIGTSFADASGAVLFSHGYLEFDAMDRRKIIRREDGKEWAYDYNLRGEVASSRKRFPAAEGGEWLSGWQASYAYDTIGNRTVTGSGGDASGANLREAVYTANSLNQYVQRTTPGSIMFTGEADSDAAVGVAVDELPIGPVLRQGAVADQRFFAAEYLADNSLAPVHGTSRIRATKPDRAPVGAVAPLFIARTPELLTYDADGNLTSDGRWIYSWNTENQLVAVETRPDLMLPAGVLPMERRLKLEYTYDAQGRRLRKQVSTWDVVTNQWALDRDVRFLYDGWNCIAEFVVNGATRSLATAYVWGLDLSGSMQGAGGVGGLLSQAATVDDLAGDYLYAHDGNGNVSGLLDVADNVVAARYDYGAFGELLQSVGPVANLNTYLFSTKPVDESGLHYYGLRYYSSSNGRWLSRDPLGEHGGLNILAMDGNDPVNWTDALGLMTESYIREMGAKGMAEQAARNNPMAFLPSWFPASWISNPVDLSFLPAGSDDEQRELWTDYLRNPDIADASYRDLLDFSKDVSLAKCYCSPQREAAQIRSAGSGWIFGSVKRFELAKPWQFTVWQGAVLTAVQYSAEHGAIGAPSPFNNDDTTFGNIALNEESKKAYKKRNRVRFDKGEHKAAWVQYEVNKIATGLNNGAQARMTRNAGRADALNMGSALIKNMGDAANSHSMITVSYDTKRKCWVAFSPGRAGPLPEIEARNLLREFFGFSGLPSPLGL